MLCSKKVPFYHSVWFVPTLQLIFFGHLLWNECWDVLLYLCYLEQGLVFLPLIFLLYLLLAEFDWWPSHQLGLCSWKLLVCSRPLPILSQYFFISHKWLGCPVSVTVVENDHFALNYFSLSSDKSVSSSPVKVCYCCILDFFKSFSPYHLCWVFYRICFFLEYFWTLSQHRFICHLPLLF